MKMTIRFHRSPHLCKVVKFCSLLALCVPNFWCHLASAFPFEYYNRNNPQDFKHKPHPDQNITSDGVPSIYNASVPMLPKNPDNLQRIGRRVNDQMTDFLNHSVIIAHIANGIALQAGLMNNTIPIDDVVSELLNLGPAGVSQIHSFRSDNVASLTSKLMETANKLKAGKDIIDAEQIAFKYNELCTTPLPGQNATEILHNDEYFEELGVILNSSLVNDVDDCNKKLNSIENDLTKISGIPLISLMDEDERRKVVSLFQNVPASFKVLFEYTGALKKSAEDVQFKKAIYRAPTYFVPLATLVHLRNVRKSITGYIRSSVQSLSENVEIVYQHIDDMKTAEKEVKKMQIVVGSRVHSVSTEKHYTSGFHFGIADVKQLETDVTDLWLFKILNINQDDLQKLGKGLLPLITASVEIKSLDDKLLSVSNSTVYQSLLNIAKLNSEVSAITPHSFNTSEVIDMYPQCTDSANYDNHDTKPVENFLKDVSLLKNSLDSITEYVSKFNFGEMKEDFDKFHSALAFKDLNNITQSLIDLPTVINNLDKLALKSLKGRVSTAKQALNDATITGIGDLLKNINDGKGTIYRLEEVFDDELSILKCLKKIEEQSSNMTKVFHVIQKLRSLDKMMFADVERVAVSISEVSKGLSSIKALPAQMKKNASIVTEKIIQLPESATTSEIIGQSANSLRNAYELLNLESSIDLLKSIDLTVQEEINNISNFKDRKSVSEQWGKDHAKDMAQLDAALVAVKAFSNKLNNANAKTIGDYCAPLVELATIPDVNISAAEKSKALETLILLNPNVKSHLRSSKEALDVIASLDLQFSSHKAQLENAPTAFGAIHSFLSQILPTTTNYFAAPMHVTGVSEGNPYSMFIMSLAAVIVGLFVGAVIGIFYFCYKSKKEMEKEKKEKEEKEEKEDMEKKEKEKKEKEEKEEMEKKEKKEKEEKKKQEKEEEQREREKKETRKMIIEEEKRVAIKDELLTFIKKQETGKYKSNLKKFEKTMATKQKGMKPSDNQGLKCRYNSIPCNPETAVKFNLDGEDFEIHANKVSVSRSWLEDEARFIATQAPLPGTIVDFWSMVVHYKCKFIVMLCNFMEDEICKADPYFALEEGEEQEFGRFKIKTTSVKRIINETTVERTLEVVDKENKHTTIKVTHFHFLAWKDHDIPDGHENVSKLMEMVEKDKSPIVVHCSAGVGRTMAFIGMNVATHIVINNPKISIDEILINLHSQRSNCMQTFAQFKWLILGINYRLIKMYELDTKVYDDQLKLFEDNKAKFEKRGKMRQNRVAAGNEAESSPEETSVEDVSTCNEEAIIGNEAESSTEKASVEDVSTCNEETIISIES